MPLGNIDFEVVGSKQLRLFSDVLSKSQRSQGHRIRNISRSLTVIAVATTTPPKLRKILQTQRYYKGNSYRMNGQCKSGIDDLCSNSRLACCIHFHTDDMEKCINPFFLISPSDGLHVRVAYQPGKQRETLKKKKGNYSTIFPKQLWQFTNNKERECGEP